MALKRTEENLWRVLFDDEEVQRSLAQLDSGTPVAAQDVDIDIETETAPEKIDTPKASLGALVKRVPLFWRGAAAGFAAGAIVAWIAHPSATEVVSTPVAAVGAKLPTPATVAAPIVVEPASQAATEPATQPASLPAGEIHGSQAASAPALEAAKTEVTKPAPEEKPVAVSGDRHDDIMAAAKDKNWARVLSLAKRSKAATQSPDTAFAIAEAQRQGGTAEAALAAYSDFFKNFPSDGHADDAEFWAAEILRQQGKSAEAKALYEKVAADENSNFKKSAQKHLTP